MNSFFIPLQEKRISAQPLRTQSQSNRQSKPLSCSFSSSPAALAVNLAQKILRLIQKRQAPDPAHHSANPLLRLANLRVFLALLHCIPSVFLFAHILHSFCFLWYDGLNSYSSFPIKGGVPLSYRLFIWFPLSVKLHLEIFLASIPYVFFHCNCKPQFWHFDHQISYPNHTKRSGKTLPQHAAEYIKTLINQSSPRISVQKMCDDTGLPKSTIDKFLAGQTTDTGWNNVMTMVKYLGGSLDHLAQIQASAQTESKPAQKEEKHLRADYPALALLVDSYEKEIHRNAEQHQQEIHRLSAFNEKYLTHVVELVETGRQALITQHNAAIQHEKDLCSAALEEKQSHLKSFKDGRDVWRALSLFLSVVLIAAAIWLVWEFSNLSAGFTGHLLRQAGLLSMAGGGV